MDDSSNTFVAEEVLEEYNLNNIWSESSNPIVEEPPDENDATEESTSEPELSVIDQFALLSESDVICIRLQAVNRLRTPLFLKIAAFTKDGVHRVMSVMSRLAEDEDSGVRGEIAKLIPRVALFFNECGGDFTYVIRQQLVPFTVKFVVDEQMNVRKAGHAALLSLFQEGLVSDMLSAEWICPFIAMQTISNSTEARRVEAITLMGNLFPIVGKNVYLRCFHETFCSLVIHTSVEIRKACALNFRHLSSEFFSNTVEEFLLDKFLNLCNDSHWSVRLRCAEVFPDVSYAVSASVRHDSFSKVFLNLLCDKHPSVQMAAYVSLGKFIHTYNQPEFYYSTQDDTPISESDNNNELDNEVSLKSHTTGSFDSFRFWQFPLPDVDLDLIDQIIGTDNEMNRVGVSSKIVLTGDDNNNVQNKEESNCLKMENVTKCDNTALPSETLELLPKPETFHAGDGLEKDQQTSEKTSGWISKTSWISSKLLSFGKSNGENRLSSKQNIVPPKILEKYIGMTGLNLDGHMQSEVLMACAFSFPAVVKTLGPKKWLCLKDMCKTFVSHCDVGVKKTIAASFHELVYLLGPEITTADLVDLYLSLFNSLVDEIGMAIVENLHVVLQYVNSAQRLSIAKKIPVLLDNCTQMNWRFRHKLMVKLCSLVECSECSFDLVIVLVPVAKSLLVDRVCHVRLVAVELLVKLFLLLLKDAKESIALNILNDLVEDFKNSSNWRWRQLFITFCRSLLHACRDVNDGQWYLKNMVRHIAPLAKDPVPNVRISLSRFIFQDWMNAFNLNNDVTHPSMEEYAFEIKDVAALLASDMDADVRFFYFQTNLPNVGWLLESKTEYED